MLHKPPTHNTNALDYPLQYKLTDVCGNSAPIMAGNGGLDPAPGHNYSNTITLDNASLPGVYCSATEIDIAGNGNNQFFVTLVAPKVTFPGNVNNVNICPYSGGANTTCPISDQNFKFGSRPDNLGYRDDGRGRRPCRVEQQRGRQRCDVGSGRQHPLFGRMVSSPPLRSPETAQDLLPQNLQLHFRKPVADAR